MSLKILEPVSNMWVRRFSQFSWKLIRISRLFQVCAQKCQSALFNLDMTADNQLIILDKRTLEQSKNHQTINKINFDEIKDFNVAEKHPLGKGVEKILTFESFVKLIEASNVNVILLSKRTDLAFVEKLRQAISIHEALFTKRIVFCSQSPITIFKVREKYYFHTPTKKFYCLQ